MTLTLWPLFFLLSLNAQPQPKIETEFFTLEAVYRVEVSPKERFDFSGVLKLSKALKKRFQLKGDFLMVSDKSSKLYQGTLSGGVLKTEPWLDLKDYTSERVWDLEDIDTDGTHIYAVNEANGAVFEVNKGHNLYVFEFFLPAVDRPYRFKEPFGIEALGVVENHLYLGKEMPPLAFFEVEIPKLSIDDKKKEHLNSTLVSTHPRSSLGSQTSFRYRDKKFYILDRESRCIWESKTLNVDENCLSTKAILESPSVNYESRDSAKRLHPEWGTAEGLDIEGDTFYLALDNNDLPLRSDPTEKRGSLLVLKRKNTPKNVK